MPDELRSYLESQQTATLELVRALVEIESPTTDRAAVNRAMDFVAARCRALEARVDVVAQQQAADRGDHLVVRWPGGGAGRSGRDAPDERQLLILIHLDTVWPTGTLAARPFRVDGGRAYGPGIYDMKASAAMALQAVAALRALRRRPRRPLTILFTSDEEIGSWTSRELIEAEARRSAAVLVMEGAERGAAVTARKGIMYFLVKALGRAAHAGMDHASGVNAIEELAHQILALQRLTDYRVGTTVSCGIVSGGRRTNVVPAEAQVEVDARVPTLAEAERLRAAVEGLRPRLPGARLETSSLLKRPPLVRDPGVARLYETARALAAEIGFRLEETGSGGISDGNFAAALGVPTLDGLGAVGEGAHAEHENIEVAALPDRIALLARLIETL